MFEQPWSEQLVEKNAKNYTESVKDSLKDFLATHGYTLDTFGEFIKELDARKCIIQIKVVRGGWEFTLLDLEEEHRRLEAFNQDIYLQAKDLGIDALMGCVEEGFRSSEQLTGRFLFSKEAQVLYSYNRSDFDGDTMVLKKHKRKQRQGGEFVQETHFRKSNNSRRKY